MNSNAFVKSGIGILILMHAISACHGQAPGFDKTRAFEALQKQCAFGPRNPGSQGHRACLDYLVSTLGQYTDRVQKQVFHDRVPGKTQMCRYTNIMASFGFQPQRILLCAHWDTRPVADQDPAPENRQHPIPGANDGASGVAILLEIARILKESPAPVGVDIVFFDAEDSGIEGDWESWCLGSQYFAKSGILKTRPEFAVLLDLVGDSDLAFPIEGYSQKYAPRFVEIIWTRAHNLGLSEFIDREGPAVIDDHLPLLRSGVPAVDIIDFDYPYWHTLEDTPDKCSAESLGTVGTLLLSLIYEGL
ncbi:M28 family peptidase [bacterium]|nr:M28 family peptidase [bacterium]